jgi:hypothetical protein
MLSTDANTGANPQKFATADQHTPNITCAQHQPASNWPDLRHQQQSTPVTIERPWPTFQWPAELFVCTTVRMQTLPRETHAIQSKCRCKRQPPAPSN